MRLWKKKNSCKGPIKYITNTVTICTSPPTLDITDKKLI